MRQISRDELESVLDIASLVGALCEGFRDEISTPVRHHHEFPNPGEGEASTLLLMPAWEAGAFLGVKVITVTPGNGRYGQPAVQGSFLLFDARRGAPLAQIDAAALTVLRTAATSALASTYLSRRDSRSLLMIGTGALAPYLIRAHAAVRPIRHVFVWGRRYERARAVADALRADGSFHIEAVPTIEEAIREADIISCATLSSTPLVLGDQLRAGQHLDLVGSFRPDMREADDEAVRRSRVFVDARQSAPHETGDLIIPIRRRVLTIAAIRADLFELCRGKHPGRKTDDEITFFKSVGHALEDLVAAKLAYQRLPR